jgi:hypothetical protein
VLPRGSTELSDLLFRSVFQQNTTHLSSPIVSSELSTSSLVLPHIENHYSLFGDGIDVSVSNDGNFQISKFQPSEISNHSLDYSTCHLPHNFGISEFHSMEADCEESSSANMASVDTFDITQLFAALSSQMMAQNNSIQEQIMQNDLKISTDFQKVIQANDDFKKDVRAELDDLRRLLSQYQNISSPSSNLTSATITSSTTTPVISAPTTIPSSSSSTTISNASISSLGSSSSTDVQTQMMMMLTESFSKLSTILVDKTSDMKSDWPKFSGDSKKFRAWYLAIMAQFSLPPWQELYDSMLNDIVQATSNTALNGKLYAKLLVSLEGSALQSIVSRKHLRANGLLLLHELTQTYKPKNVPEVIAAKASEFWGATKRLSTETVDVYYNRFHELLDEINDADEPISTKNAMRHFIFTLGSEFETIQNNFRIGNLPSQWNTQDWPTLLVLCRDYFNSVKPQGVSRRDQSGETSFDRVAQHKKVKE